MSFRQQLVEGVEAGITSSAVTLGRGFAWLVCWWLATKLFGWSLGAIWHGLGDIIHGVCVGMQP